MESKSKLRKLREKASWSPARLAVEAEVDPSTVYNLESGRSPGTLRVWRKLAKALKVDVREILP